MQLHIANVIDSIISTNGVLVNVNKLGVVGETRQTTVNHRKTGRPTKFLFHLFQATTTMEPAVANRLVRRYGCKSYSYYLQLCSALYEFNPHG